MDQRGFFLGCRRRDDRSVLQCVQGGAIMHETPQQTAEREVFEEIGLPAQYLRFIGEVKHIPPTTEQRAPFRYKSKTWRSMGIVGQELYPLLYIVDTNVIRRLNFTAVPSVRPEFFAAEWVELDELVQHSSRSKREAVTNICRAVVPLAHYALGSGRTPNLGDVAMQEPLSTPVLEGSNDDKATRTAKTSEGQKTSGSRRRRRGARRR